MGMHIFQTPRPIREHDPSIPLEIQKLVHRMLAKDSEERPTMSEVASLLRDFSSNFSISPARPVPLGWARTVTITAVLIVVLGVGTWSLVRNLRSPGTVVPSTPSKVELPSNSLTASAGSATIHPPSPPITNATAVLQSQAPAAEQVTHAAEVKRNSITPARKRQRPVGANSHAKNDVAQPPLAVNPQLPALSSPSAPAIPPPASASVSPAQAATTPSTTDAAPAPEKPNVRKQYEPVR